MQPLVVDPDGIVRFKKNAIVDFLVEFARGKGMSLNEIACMPFDADDRSQLSQLTGYSVSGFGELSYANQDHVKAADKAAESIGRSRKKRGKK